MLYEPDPVTNSDDRASYEHAIQLSDGTILATFERQLSTGSDPGRGWLIYRSTDRGATFERIARVEPHGLPEATNALQPALMELHTDTGDLEAGTVVLAAETGQDGGFDVQLFTSTDKGETWNYLSTPERTRPGTDGERRIWEPFPVQLDDGRLVVYYSDEIVPGREQNIAYKTSDDGGLTWSAPVDAWNPTGPDDRPGMSTVARMGDGRYIMSVEFCGNANAPVDYCRVRFKTSDDGLDWGDPTDWGTRPQTGTGHLLHGNPMVAWSPAGGPDGTVILTAGALIESLDQPHTEAGGHGQTLLVNHDNGEGEWHELTAPMPTTYGGYQSGYRNAVLPIDDGGDLLFLTASHVGGDTERNRVVHGSSNAGVLPYDTAFADGTDLGWDTFGGDWSVADEVYSESEGGPGHKSVAGSTAWTDYTMEGRVRLDGTGNAGLLVRVSDPEVGPDAHEGYYVGISDEDGGAFIGRQSHDWTRLGDVRPMPGGIERGAWYDVSVTASGCTFAVRAEPADGSGEPVAFEETDPGCAASGAIGVRTFGTAASWRDITVTPAG
ncbi:hypothetical protein GCM10022205_17640 [Spinactinospora alkalitolerans]